MKLGVIVLLGAVATAHAQPRPSTRPTETVCRGYVQDGLAKTNHDEARVLFHASRVRCGNIDALILIARSYEQQGDLPRALAYLEAFLAVAHQRHEARAVVEDAATVLRQRVPVEQRVGIAAELAASGANSATDFDTAETRLNSQVEGVDYRAHNSGEAGERKIGRGRGLFFGANLAYAPRGRIDVQTGNLDGMVELPAAFAAELQGGYRIRPFLSVALASQMLFNVKPNHEDSANELGVFVQAIGHLALRSRWDLNVFVAPGFSVLFVPDASDAKGLAFRYGGGPMFHVSEHISVGVEFSHQLGFQKADRGGGDADMRTSFLSLVAGVRLRR